MSHHNIIDGRPNNYISCIIFSEWGSETLEQSPTQNILWSSYIGFKVNLHKCLKYLGFIYSYDFWRSKLSEIVWYYVAIHMLGKQKNIVFKYFLSLSKSTRTYRTPGRDIFEPEINCDQNIERCYGALELQIITWFSKIELRLWGH